MTMRVWYQLDGESPDRVEVNDDADVVDLRDAIKAKNSNKLSNVDAPALDVFDAGADPETATAKRAGDNVPTGTTDEDPLIVVTKYVLQGNFKRQRLKRSFDANRLLPPLEVLPPTNPPEAPEFTCKEDWLDTIEIEIQSQLESSDSKSGSQRVPPMALVRCSRGGKTRALYEIANVMSKTSNIPNLQHREPIAVIYVSFNDFSPLLSEEQDHPLDALCRRIAFAALEDPPTDNKIREAFEKFRSEDYDIGPKQIEQWIGESPAILLVDELNNLKGLAEKGEEATKFGDFVKRLFLQPEGRYFVFSSHILSTLADFDEFIDPSGSFRHVTLQELPLVDDLSIAMERLYKNLDGAREAIYYGLLPGILYEQSRGKPVTGKREIAVRRYNNESTAGTKDKFFKEILRSLFSGDIDAVPDQLHLLLDGCGEEGSQKIRWVPFHLEYVLDQVTFSEESKLRKLSKELAKLCKGLKEAEEGSGKGWEALFVLFLVARCINHCHDGYFVPEHWFESPSVKFEFNPYFNAKKPFNHCQTWEHLKKGITASKTPTVSVFYPSHSSFNVVDAIAVYSAENCFVDVYGYQLKEGKKNPTTTSIPPADFRKSFVVRGDPPIQSQDRNGFSFPCGDVIDRFFGESGKYWTPQHWKLLTDTCSKEGGI